MKNRIGIINALWAIAVIYSSFIESRFSFHFINLIVTVILMNLLTEKERYKKYVSIFLIVMQMSFFCGSVLYASAFADVTNLIKALSVIFVLISFLLLLPIKEEDKHAN